MAATVTIRVNTGASAGTESDSVSGIDLISADNATNNLTNRQDNPITAGDSSYEKWLTAKVDAPPDNYVEEFEIWGDGSVDANTTLYVGVTATGVTPTSGDSTVATNNYTTYTSGNKFSWHTSQLTATNETTDFLVLQLDTTVDASAGNWSQETINYSYNEA